MTISSLFQEELICHQAVIVVHIILAEVIVHIAHRVDQAAAVVHTAHRTIRAVVVVRRAITVRCSLNHAAVLEVVLRLEKRVLHNRMGGMLQNMVRLVIIIVLLMIKITIRRAGRRKMVNILRKATTMRMVSIIIICSWKVAPRC